MSQIGNSGERYKQHKKGLLGLIEWPICVSKKLSDLATPDSAVFLIVHLCSHSKIRYHGEPNDYN
mgnify:CR=1 FL=1